MIAIDKALPFSRRMALSAMKRYSIQEARWHYDHGLILQSIFILGEKTGDDQMCSWVKAMYDSLVSDDGTINTYLEEEYSLDQINPGKTLFFLYKKYGEEKYRKAIECLMEQLRHHPRTKTNGLWHKKIYPWQIWLDGIYMADVFHAQYAAEFGDSGDVDDVVHQFTLTESKTRDGETGLLYHAWDEARKQLWANPETGCSPHFWGRAMGWYCMAIADTLDFIGADHQKQRDTLKAIACRLVTPLLKFQDKESFLWRQILDHPSNGKNYTESSASAMFVYFLFKMSRLGIIPKIDTPVVREAASMAYQSLIRDKVKEDDSGILHLVSICKGAGLGGNPYRDGSLNYYLNEPIGIDDFKGVGAFILASMEAESL